MLVLDRRLRGLFGEGEYSQQELLSYLGARQREGKIEDRYDSDNKARAVVRLWKTGNRAIQLNPQLKKLLVREMWKGATTADDAQGIMDILDRSLNEDILPIFSTDGVSPKDLFSAFPKAARPRLQAFFSQRFKGGFDAAMKNTVEPVGTLTVTPYLNDQTFRQKWNKGLKDALDLLRGLRDKGACSFPRPDERRIDESNWRPFQSNKDRLMATEGFAPKNATPYDAVSLLFDNLDKWTCDCRLFPEIALLYAWREALRDSPQAFNSKFAGLVLRTEGTTGLEREVVQTDEDLMWKNAPVGTKVVWQNTSQAAKVPWTYEHGIKTFKGKPDEEDLFTAHPLGYDRTEQQVKQALAENSSDYPRIYKITVDSVQGLTADGVDTQVVSSLRSVLGLEAKGMRAFLDFAPLVALRKQAKQDPAHFTLLINAILKHARQKANPDDAKTYVETYIRRFKLEIPK